MVREVSPLLQWVREEMVGPAARAKPAQAAPEALEEKEAPAMDPLGPPAEPAVKPTARMVQMARLERAALISAKWHSSVLCLQIQRASSNHT